jgi:hypothetical protein
LGFSLVLLASSCALISAHGGSGAAQSAGAHGRVLRTVADVVADGIAVLVQVLLGDVVIEIELLLARHVHCVQTEHCATHTLACQSAERARATAGGEEAYAGRGCPET